MGQKVAPPSHKAVTPMKKLKSHIDAIFEVCEKYGFSLVRLNRRKAEAGNYYYNSKGRKSVDFDAVYIIHNGNLFNHDRSKTKEIESFAMSFNYKDNPENPSIYFSVKSKGADQYTYSGELTLSEAKGILSKLKVKLSIDHAEKKISRNDIFKTIQSSLIGSENKSELKKIQLDNENKFNVALTELIKDEINYEESLKKQNKAFQLLINKVKALPEQSELSEIEKQIKKLTERRDKIRKSIDLKRDDISEDIGVKELKKDSENKKIIFLEKLKKLKNLSLFANFTASELHEKIEQTKESFLNSTNRKSKKPKTK